MWILEHKDLDELLELWNSVNQVLIPTKQYGDINLLPYEKEKLDLDYINFSQPVKEFLLKSKEALFEWKYKDDGIKLTNSSGYQHYQQLQDSLAEAAVTISEKDLGKASMRSFKEPNGGNTILFGVRACDVNGIAYMDRFFQGEYCDDVYKGNRENTLIIALNCVKIGEQCFCNSLGTGPFVNVGYDLLLTPIGDKYLVEVNGDKGIALIEISMEYLKPAMDYVLENKMKLLKGLESKFTTIMNNSNIKEVLKKGFNDDVWAEMAAKCIRCGGCTNVCPTCTCYNVIEENTAENSGKRIRCWDSCQSDSFTKNAGGHKPRNNISRVRYRIYDKLKYIEERFEHKGCTGCGRCITTCAVDINIVNIMNRLSEKYKSEEINKAQIDSTKFEIHVHKNCEEVYMPKIAIIKDIIQESKSIKKFILQYEDKSLHESFEYSGQFFEISVFGVGEIAISIPFSNTQKEYFDFCVKNVGKVTRALHNMQIGDKVGLRGPFGKGFPYEAMKGRDILIVGSGVGVAPVRTVIVRMAEEREQFGKIVIVGSAISYEDLIYKKDFINWEKNNMKVLYALNKPTDKVDAHVGYINDLLPDMDNNWSNTGAIICASPRRIKEVAKDLIKLGMSGKDIYTCLETHMRCGIGKCGHCKVGNKYMCVDGPVFNYEEMLLLPPEF
jgi:NAD(P)H-flavin reductase/ferredoxin